MTDRPHRYRPALLAALASAASPASAQEIHATLRRGGLAIGLSTVYRELHAMARSGQARAAHVGNETVYRAAGRDLLVCDSCGRTEELPRPPRTPMRFPSFFGPHETITVHGRCAVCAAQR